MKNSRSVLGPFNSTVIYFFIGHSLVYSVVESPFYPDRVGAENLPRVTHSFPALKEQFRHACTGCLISLVALNELHELVRTDRSQPY